MLKYPHCRPLKSIAYRTVTASPEHADELFKHAYSWLEKQVGFYPIFYQPAQLLKLKEFP